MSRLPNLPVRAIEPLFEGPIDIVGDVHGEWEALQRLLDALGYNRHGEHRAGRRLVFVGDLCDRGPDSPAVLEFVGRLLERGLAQCLLGNHELSVLREERKRGNGWYFDEHPEHGSPEFGGCRQIDERGRETVRAMLAQLPLVLERTDLRVVHAAPHATSLEAVRRAPPASTLDRYREFEQQALAAVPSDVVAGAEAERQAWRNSLRHAEVPVPLLSNIGIEDSTYQMCNPLRVLTSGVERPAAQSYFLAGKWRMVERAAWWDEYGDSQPVVVGHYWRRLAPSPGTKDLFGPATAADWLGPRGSVYCVDFSVGARFHERLEGSRVGTWTRLAALRWPEAELVDEFGQRVVTRPMQSLQPLP